MSSLLLMTNESARGVLRGLIREATRTTPSPVLLNSKAYAIMKCRDVGTALTRLNKLFEPYSLATYWDIDRKANYLEYKTKVPYFGEHEEHGWQLQCFSVDIIAHKGQVAGRRIMTTPIFTGHALERLFQRSLKLDWNIVRQELKAAMRSHWLWAKIGDKIPHQIVLPTSDGAFIGEAVWGTRDLTTNDIIMPSIVMRTYLRKNERVNRVAKAINAIDQACVDHRKDKTFDAQKYIQQALLEIYTNEPWLLEKYQPSEDPNGNGTAVGRISEGRVA